MIGCREQCDAMRRILIADDHTVVRRGLKQILQDAWPSTVFGEAKNAHEAIKLILTQEWDIVVLDITLPGRSGIEVLKKTRQTRPDLPILVLSMHPADQYAARVIKAGAAGYMTKESAPEELVSAVRRVMAGNRYISSSLAEQLAVHLADRDENPHHSLSDREYEVLCLIGAGKTVSQIASERSLSVKTISTYQRRLMRKMGLPSVRSLMHYAIKKGLVG
jgi:two-component system invasion response regulator UvrY